LPVTTITTDSFTYEGETINLSDIAFRPNSTTLAVVGDEISEAGVVQLWNAATGDHLADFVDQLFGGKSIVFTGDGATLISAGYEMHLWDVAEGIRRGGAEQGDELAVLPADDPEFFWYAPFELKDAAVSPDNQKITTFSGDNYLQNWDIHTGEYISVKFSGTEASSLEFSPDSSRLIAYESEMAADSLTLWDVNKLAPLRTEFFGRGTVWSSLDGVAVSPTESYLVYAYTIQYGDSENPTAEYYLSFLDAASGETLHEMPTNLPSPINVFRPILNPDSSILITGTFDQLYGWNVQDLMQEDAVTEDVLLFTSDYDSYVMPLTFSLNGSQLIAVHGFLETIIDIRDIETGDVATSLTINEQFQQKHLYADADQVLFAGVAGTNTDEIEIWDVLTGELLHTLPGNDWRSEIVFSPGGTFLASVKAGSFNSQDGILLWNVATGEQYAALNEEGFWYIDALEFNADGTILASGHGDEYADSRPGQPEYILRLWDVEHQQELTELRGHTGSITRIQFSPDGTLIATYGNEGVIRLWGIPVHAE
jgi:WD40 repeat protein